MQYAQKRGLDRLIIVNKIDAENVDCEDLLERIQQAFGKECLPLNLPAGDSQQGLGLLLRARPARPISPRWRRRTGELVEQVVEVDEKLMEKYLEKGEVTPGGAARAARAGAARGAFDSGGLHFGQDRRRHRRAARSDRQAAGESDRGQSARLRQHADGERRRHRGAAAGPRSGQARARARVQDRDRSLHRPPRGVPRAPGAPDRRTCSSTSARAASRSSPAHLYMLRGKTQTEVQEAIPGDICAIAKIDEIQFDHILHDSRRGRARARAAARAADCRCSVSRCSRRSAATSRRCPTCCTRSPPRIRASASSTTRRRTRP